MGIVVLLWFPWVFGWVDCLAGNAVGYLVVDVLTTCLCFRFNCDLLFGLGELVFGFGCSWDWVCSDCIVVF